jgi:hypothetical protein
VCRRGVYTRWVGLQVIAEKMEIYSCIHVQKKSLSTGYFPKDGPISSACTVELI